MAVRTHGLTHVSLAVRDVGRSAHFYREVFGCATSCGDDDGVMLTTPGTRDVIALDRKPDAAPSAPGASGGLAHLGLPARGSEGRRRGGRGRARVGGTLKRRGEFAPGCPHAYVFDPDGYLVEIWFE